jgi:hypothetical protein
MEMLLRAWYFVAVMLTALLMGTSFGHTLEMPAKMKVDGVLWMTFQHTLYPYFAYAGAPIELGAIASAAGLAYLLRGRHPGFYPALVAAICLAAAFFIVWLGFTNVVNSETGKWTADTIPADWAAWRRQWEFSHAVRFVLHLAGLTLLVFPFVASAPALDASKRPPA